MQFVNDTFTGSGNLEAHTGETGATWARYGSTGAGTIIISSNKCVPNVSASAEAIYYASGVPTTADYSIKWDFVQGSSSHQVLGVVARADTASPNKFYTARYNAQVGTWELYVFSSIYGIGYLLLGNFVQEISTSAVYACELRVEGTRISFYVNGVCIIAATNGDITAVGKAGVTTYLYSGSNTGSIDNFQVIPLAPSDTDVEGTGNQIIVTWTAVPGSTGYNVKRATSFGGSYSTIGSNVAGPSYTDTPPTNAIYYYAVSSLTVSGTVESIDSNIASGSIKIPISADSATPAHFIVAKASQTRKNLVKNAAGTYLGAMPFNVKFDLIAGQIVTPGPFSYNLVHLDERFLADFTPTMVVTPIGAATTTFGSGKMAISGGSGTYSNVKALNKYKASCIAIGLEIDSFSGTGANLNVGFGDYTSALEGIFLEYDPNGHTLKLFTWPANNTVMAATAFNPGSSSFKIAIDIIATHVTAWGQIGNDPWVVIGGGFVTRASIYDLRISGKLATWSPIISAGSASGSWTGVVRRFLATAWNGPGMLREMAFITTPDGVPVQTAEGYYLISTDRCGRPWGGDFGTPTAGQIHPYDPNTGRLGFAICNLTMLFGSVPAATAELKIIYDHARQGYHIWSVDWCAGSGALDTANPRIYYQFWRGELVGDIHLTEAILLTLPGARPYPYGPDVIYRNGLWYMAVTWMPDFIQGIVSGPSPDNFDTNVVEDTVNVGEGTCWLPFGSRLYLTTGRSSGGQAPNGTILCWDFTDLTTMQLGSYIRYSCYMPVGLPQQPCIGWMAKGNRSVLQILGFTEQYFGGEAPAAGPTVIYEGDATLTGWQNYKLKPPQSICGVFDNGQ